MTEFMDPASGVFGDQAFHQLLVRETSRATRYQDFFSLCLARPDWEQDDGGDERVQQAVARKIAEFLRATDVVGQTGEGIAILLLNTPETEAVSIAERIRAHIQSAVFQLDGDRAPRRVTLSTGLVSFPRDGSNAAILIARAKSHLDDASKRGGNRVVGAGGG